MPSKNAFLPLPPALCAAFIGPESTTKLVILTPTFLLQCPPPLQGQGVNQGTPLLGGMPGYTAFSSWIVHLPEENLRLYFKPPFL